jgi:beta-phosphoglucomutase-like phosphatase (HAD superfamily)
LPAECVAIEDSANGIRSGAAAGMTVIAVPNRDFPPDADALALAAGTQDSVGGLTSDCVEAAARSRRLGTNA